MKHRRSIEQGVLADPTSQLADTVEPGPPAEGREASGPTSPLAKAGKASEALEASVTPGSVSTGIYTFLPIRLSMRTGHCLSGNTAPVGTAPAWRDSVAWAHPARVRTSALAWAEAASEANRRELLASLLRNRDRRQKDRHDPLGELHRAQAARLIRCVTDQVLAGQGRRHKPPARQPAPEAYWHNATRPDTDRWEAWDGARWAILPASLVASMEQDAGEEAGMEPSDVPSPLLADRIVRELSALNGGAVFPVRHVQGNRTGRVTGRGTGGTALPLLPDGYNQKVTVGEGAAYGTLSRTVAMPTYIPTLADWWERWGYAHWRDVPSPLLPAVGSEADSEQPGTATWIERSRQAVRTLEAKRLYALAYGTALRRLTGGATGNGRRELNRKVNSANRRSVTLLSYGEAVDLAEDCAQDALLRAMELATSYLRVEATEQDRTSFRRYWIARIAREQDGKRLWSPGVGIRSWVRRLADRYGERALNRHASTLRYLPPAQDERDTASLIPERELPADRVLEEGELLSRIPPAARLLALHMLAGGSASSWQETQSMSYLEVKRLEAAIASALPAKWHKVAQGKVEARREQQGTTGKRRGRPRKVA